MIQDKKTTNLAILAWRNTPKKGDFYSLAQNYTREEHGLFYHLQSNYYFQNAADVEKTFSGTDKKQKNTMTKVQSSYCHSQRDKQYEFNQLNKEISRRKL